MITLKTHMHTVDPVYAMYPYIIKTALTPLKADQSTFSHGDLVRDIQCP